MDLNKVMIIGRLTRDPELKSTPNGASVCRLGLATNYVYTNQQTGQKVEQVEFHNAVLWRKLAEIAAQYLKKGRRVYIEGRLQTRDWTTQDGQARKSTEIVVDNMIMLDGGPGAGASPSAPQNPSAVFPASRPVNQNSYAPNPLEELPTIEADEAIIEDIPF